jgi:hypothetical protein
MSLSYAGELTLHYLIIKEAMLLERLFQNASDIVPRTLIEPQTWPQDVI